MMRDMCLLMGDKLHPHVQLMIDLGKAMADERLPKDSSIQPPEQRVDRCIQALKEAAGEEVLAEAAAVVAMFSAMTIVVDATGQTSKEMAKIQPAVSRMLRWKKTLAACCPCIG
ncbi:unnamed protein product [Durusdinium trenchii]|uniref:Uncharacterized protein n=2 Tax=Durusdinium trenchii TaxID=1381693 RepID=A0ABP0LF29_9DINO